MMSAVLSNPNHPKYGAATIPFPIPRDQSALLVRAQSGGDRSAARHNAAERQLSGAVRFEKIKKTSEKLKILFVEMRPWRVLK